MQTLDETDISFFACPCNYQAWHCVAALDTQTPWLLRFACSVSTTLWSRWMANARHADRPLIIPFSKWKTTIRQPSTNLTKWERRLMSGLCRVSVQVWCQPQPEMTTPSPLGVNGLKLSRFTKIWRFVFVFSFLDWGRAKSFRERKAEKKKAGWWINMMF